jgi:predicted RNA-binding Zn-ribbon protein involved in translation (DUF1610 family)
MAVDATLTSSDLDETLFECQHLDHVPFACPKCHRKMVACASCDSVYDDLADLSRVEMVLSNVNPAAPVEAFSCPNCGYGFEFLFMKNEQYRVSRQEWLEAGLGHLLKAAPR